MNLLHSNAVNADVIVQVFGDNSRGQLGTGRVTTKAVVHLTTLPLAAGVEPRQLAAAGEAHSALLTTTGELLTWGSNKHGQLGRPVAGEPACSAAPGSVRASLPRALRSMAVSHVACGANFTAVVMSSGALLTCGDGACGQLGHGDRRARSTLKQIELPPTDRVREVTCGARHMLVTMHDGSLRACGDNADGQLGLGVTAESSVASLQALDALWCVPIVQLAAGAAHTLALGASGDLYVWARRTAR
jgi:alpha-tubulin suppressor-like RCC1 family protein